MDLYDRSPQNRHHCPKTSATRWNVATLRLITPKRAIKWWHLRNSGGGVGIVTARTKDKVKRGKEEFERFS